MSWVPMSFDNSLHPTAYHKNMTILCFIAHHTLLFSLSINFTTYHNINTVELVVKENKNIIYIIPILGINTLHRIQIP